MDERELLNLVSQEEDDAVGYQDDLGQKRETLLSYYQSEPFGDEVEGRSKYVSSDVSDVVEGMLPSILRVFTQGRIVGKFWSDTLEGEEEAKQKTELTNYVFFRQNQGVLILHNMLKDALLQYTGVVKVRWNTDEEVTHERYSGLSELEFRKLESDEETEIDEVEEETNELGQKVYECRVTRTKERGTVQYDNIPPEEFLICRDARDFVRPRFIGQRTPKRRSELLQMGFDPDIVESLPKYSGDEDKGDQLALIRNRDISGDDSENPSNHKPNDIIYLTECYTYVDMDGDGIAELYQVFKAGEQILEYNEWDEHPFAVITPIPMPHRAIGTCPAEQTADIQFTKSVLVRNMLDNIYATNYNRYAVNDRVDLDDLLNPRHGGAVQVEGEMSVGDALMPLVTTPISQNILQSVEYIDAARESRTGLSRINQGLDPETLNKTATGFQGIMNASQQRLELITRICAETGIKRIFRLTAMYLAKYQDEAIQIRVTGKPMEVDPTAWRYNLDCYVDVGIGSGDRQEKIASLNTLLNMQLSMIQSGMLLTDQSKVYNTLDKLTTELGLKGAQGYFNNPEMPDEVLQAQVEMLSGMVQQLQAQAQQNPLAEAEMIKAQARLTEAQGKGQLEAAKAQAETQKFMMKLAQEDDHFRQELIKQLTELELKYGTNVPGAAV